MLFVMLVDVSGNSQLHMAPYPSLERCIEVRDDLKALYDADIKITQAIVECMVVTDG